MREAFKPIPSTAKPVTLAETGGTAAKRPTYVLLCANCQWTGRRKSFTHGRCPSCKQINQLGCIGHEP
jgi:hypothetical protein